MTQKNISVGELARAAVGLPGFKLPVDNLSPGIEVTESVIIEDMAFSNGSAVAEVEVDIDTGHVIIHQFSLAHDCGRMINPMIVDGQIVGGIAHGISNALFEWMGFDEDAQPITTTYADYLLVSAAEMPSVAIFHHESPSPLNELGVKGVGESGVIPTIAAITSAIEDALSPLGVAISQAPLTAGVLWNLIHSSAGNDVAFKTKDHWNATGVDLEGLNEGYGADD